MSAVFDKRLERPEIAKSGSSLVHGYIYAMLETNL